MKPIPLVMIRETLADLRLRDLPFRDLPPGFSLRTFESGDEEHWARIEASAGEFPSVEHARAHFDEEFGTRARQRELRERCLFLQAKSGEPIGTAMAWYGILLPGASAGKLPGRPTGGPTAGLAGRLHWVAIRREFQGRGLGKALASRALEMLAARHDRAYLTTQTSSLAAVKIYLDFGFRPYIMEKIQEKGWAVMSERLGLPDLVVRHDA